ncbi:hypothetical protein Acr_05g0000040 [Actinidia rufa]|uniref:Secreted protein n=1 Tax=Actinidia rufa TaxID=165716 RepID=A0A7J0EIR3_9ERIC|nr:hypothetical protein Acr_05g0000040 [Actinidia rufa]
MWHIMGTSQLVVVVVVAVVAVVAKEVEVEAASQVRRSNLKRWKWPKLAEEEAVAWQVVASVDLVYEGCPSQDGGSDIGSGGKTPPCVGCQSCAMGGGGTVPLAKGRGRIGVPMVPLA